MDTQQPSTFKVYRAADAQAMTMEEGHVSWDNVEPSDLQKMKTLLSSGMDQGATVRCLFEDAKAGMSLSYGWFKANFMVPRHSHDCDCLYAVTSGEMHIGDQVLKAGDGVFLPGESLYTFKAGPEGLEILEFRTALHFDIKIRNSSAIWDRMTKMVGDNVQTWRETPPPAVAQKLKPRAKTPA